MSVKSKLANLEKRMQVGDLMQHCPLCRTRPAEVWMTHDQDQPLPPSKQPPCPLCGKGPLQIVMYMENVAGIAFEGLNLASYMDDY
jgi:hypothetical protein